MNDKINSINKEIKQEKKLHQTNKNNINFHNSAEQKRHDLRINFLKDKKKKARQNKTTTSNDYAYNSYASETKKIKEELEYEIEKAIFG